MDINQVEYSALATIQNEVTDIIPKGILTIISQQLLGLFALRVRAFVFLGSHL